jgi:hypothetical protein
MLHVIQICGNNLGTTEDTDDPQLDKVTYKRICPSSEVTSHLSHKGWSILFRSQRGKVVPVLN